MKKKLTAIILTLTMMLSCLVPVYAEDMDAMGENLVSHSDTESTDDSDMYDLPADIADTISESDEEETSETEAALPGEDMDSGTESDGSPVPDDELMIDQPYDLYDEMAGSAAEVPSDESDLALDESGLALDDAARMNVPGTAEGNWSWQADEAAIGQTPSRLRWIVALHPHSSAE
jgi:hypothetical protein